MKPETLQIWQSLPDSDKTAVFNETAARMGLPGAAVEKDWWVVRTLQLVYESSIAPHTVFKGGTSLSKAWKLIDRFSEDIDLALDRSFLGFQGALSSSQVRKLRRRSFGFISEQFFPEMKQAFANAGFADVTLHLAEVRDHDQDPLIIEAHYRTLTDEVAYLPPKVRMEIGSRSLMEPFTVKSIRSFVGEEFANRPFADEAIEIPCVNPERTFLEKIFLLHEEFQQASDRVRVERKSRHLYDLVRLMNTPFGHNALADTPLYRTIVEHRRTITPLRGIDYSLHEPQTVNPIPPDSLLDEWRKDYDTMRTTMLFNDPAAFTSLMSRMDELKRRVNALVLPQ